MAPRKILLVEDNADDVELTVHAFRKAWSGEDIIVARDGETALDYLFGAESCGGEPLCPALVLLDLNLPGINGHEVLRRLRERPATRRVPVVVMTTSDDDADVLRSYDLGVNSYVRKPVEFRDFTSLVQQLGLYWLVTNIRAPQ
jgi:two-component system response regulator